MTLTQVDVDDEALADAMRVAGAKTKSEAINLALREFVARHRRSEAVERYASLAAHWDFEGWQRRRAASSRRH